MDKCMHMHTQIYDLVCVCDMCVFVNVSIFAKRKPPTSFQKTLNIWEAMECL